jgi:hypothetical protein
MIIKREREGRGGKSKKTICKKCIRFIRLINEGINKDVRKNITFSHPPSPFLFLKSGRGGVRA